MKYLVILNIISLCVGCWVLGYASPILGLRGVWPAALLVALNLIFVIVRLVGDTLG